MIHHGTQPTIILYLAKQGGIIHTETCRYADDSYKTTWAGAVKQVKAKTAKHGYTPCGICRPFETQ